MDVPGQRSNQDRPLRLLLVNPNIVAKNGHMHVGLVTIGSYVRANSRHEVRITDFTTTRGNDWERRLRADLMSYRPDIVGMYLSTPYFPFARQVAAFIKRHAEVPIVAGGHHATLAPRDVLADVHFDWLVEGEGERAVVALLETVAARGPLNDVPGLWFRDADGLRNVPKAPLLTADEIPTLDWSLIGTEILEATFHVWGILPVMASRGCPSGCSFCSITEIQKRYPGQKFLRFREPRKVVQEIAADYERFRHLGFRTVQFVDLNFLFNVEWLREFTDEYRKAGLHRTLPWSAFSRMDHVTPASVECLKDSGCVNLRVGIEAANPWMRNTVYRKNLSQQRLEAGLGRMKDAGISVTGYFMAGGPGERPEWLLESLDFVHRWGIDLPYFFHYKPLASSEILERAASLGSSVREDALEKAADFLHGVTMRHDHIAEWQLVSFVALAHGLFTAPIVADQIRRTGPVWLAQVARYVRRTHGMGFPLHLALAYFVLYGEDHLTAPYLAPARPAPSVAWKALMRGVRFLLLPSKGHGNHAPGRA